MNANRKGTNLRIQIRIALSVLGRDADEIDTRRMSIADMEKLHRELYAEYKAKRAA